MPIARARDAYWDAERAISWRGSVAIGWKEGMACRKRVAGGAKVQRAGHGSPCGRRERGDAPPEYAVRCRSRPGGARLNVTMRGAHRRYGWGRDADGCRRSEVSAVSRSRSTRSCGGEDPCNVRFRSTEGVGDPLHVFGSSRARNPSVRDVCLERCRLRAGGDRQFGSRELGLAPLRGAVGGSTASQTRWLH